MPAREWRCCRARLAASCKLCRLIAKPKSPFAARNGVARALLSKLRGRSAPTTMFGPAMTAAIAIPVTTTPAAAALIGASASSSASQTQSAGEGFAAALAALLNGGAVTAQPQTTHAPKQHLAATDAATAIATTEAQVDASAVVVPVVPGLILPAPAQAPAKGEPTTPAAQINAQASQASALQILQAAQTAATEQAAITPASDQAPAQAPATAIDAQSFAALAATAQQTQTPAPATAKAQAKPVASKEAPAPAGKDMPAANANATAPTTESKAEANTHLANAIQHALSNNSNGNAQTGNGNGNGNGDGATQLPATASPVAFALHTANIDTTTATAPAATPVAVPLDALAVHIARKVEGGESRFEIRLDPIELGKLDISVTVTDDGRVQAVIRAERPETLDMLQRDARLLEGQLRQSGLNVDSGSLNFSLNQGNNQRSGFAGNDQAFANAIKAVPEVETAATNTTTTVVSLRDGVDIRI